MEDNVADCGNRITRSQRKRLTSVDCEISSRPCTPVSIKLPLISEISASPSKVRTTRRSSISGNATPVKTPAKRGIASVLVENLQTLTPARRSTRRCSVSVNENEEAGLTGLKVLKLDALNEESDGKEMVFTRSKSQSPQQSTILKISPSPKKSKSPTETKNKDKELQNIKMQIQKKRKPGPKSKTRESMESEEMSEVEISVFGDDIEEVQNKTSDATEVILIDDESNQISTNEKIEIEINANDGIKQSLLLNNVSEEKNTNTSELHIENNYNSIERKVTDVAESTNEHKISDEFFNVSQSKKVENTEPILHVSYENIEEEVNVEESARIENEEKLKEVACYEIKRNSSHSEDIDFVNDDVREKVLPKSNFKDCYNREENKIEIFIEKDKVASDESWDICKTPELKITPSLSEKTQILSVRTIMPFESKKVDFMTSPSSDTVIKSIYPKTPASKKTTITSNELQTSLHGDSFQEASNLESHQNVMQKVQDNEIDVNSEDVDLPITQVDFSSKSDMSKNSTLINNEEEDLQSVLDGKGDITAEKSLNNLEDINIDNLTNISTGNNNNDSSPKPAEEDLTWTTPSAKGKSTDGSKLDGISANATNSLENTDNNTENKQRNKKNTVFSSDGLEEDDENLSEEELREKLFFEDEEAMEVDNYESGDSMDSEERREAEENEVPVEAESIGSQTTDDDQGGYTEEEDSCNSFIVSDNEKLECSESDEDGEIDEAITEQKIYKRLQLPSGSSSSSDEEMEEKKLESVGEDTDVIGENVKIRLHSTNDSKCGEEQDKEEINKSRQEIIREINNSERFNKSVRDFTLDSDKSPIENVESPKQMQDDNDEKSFRERHTSSSPLTEDDDKPADESIKDVDTQLREVNGTSESDTDGDNKKISLKHHQKSSSGLSVSFGNYKRPKGRHEWQRSFTIDVAIKDGELETAVINKQLEENESSSLSSNDNQENEKMENSESSEYIENVKHVPLQLGNPLIRTRRQSLALPTNPDMEICTSHAGTIGKKENRRSLGLLSNIDFKPSQSFIESMELEKGQHSQLIKKRKRLSKSFSGTADTHDSSIIDIDTQQLRKRSKLSDGNCLKDSDNKSTENINSSKLTKHNLSDSYNKHILARCDEILQSANEAKLEAKIRNKKKKTKISKKQWKKKSVLTESEETSPAEDVIRRIPKETKLKDKTKTALSQAFKAADVILSKSKEATLKGNNPETKQPHIVGPIGKAGLTKEKCKKEIIEKKEKTENLYATSAGNFMEFPQTPEKMKKRKYIQLPTGKVSVEPITPKKGLMQVFNGISFRESPVTPYAVGFKITKDIPTENNNAGSSILRTGKRKRNASLQGSCEIKGQWTQSGLFTEEEISKNFKVESKKTKKPQIGKKQQPSVIYNFKENAMLRPEINRITKQELFYIKEQKRSQ